MNHSSPFLRFLTSWTGCIVFMEQRAEGTLKLWANPFTALRVPLIFNLRRDPYERAPITSNTYYDWLLDHVFLLVPAQGYVGRFLETFKAYPPRMEAASFSLDRVMETLSEPISGSQQARGVRPPLRRSDPFH